MKKAYLMKEYDTQESWIRVKDRLGLDFPNLPYLIDGDIKITQCAAIHKYLAERYMPPLLGESY